MLNYNFNGNSYRAQCVRVIDGDTAQFFCDMGFNTYTILRFRFSDVDTPELNSKDLIERSKAKEAKERVIEWLNPGPIDMDRWNVKIKSYKADSFGRWLADLWWMDDSGVEHHVNAELLQEGLAVPYSK